MTLNGFPMISKWDRFSHKSSPGSHLAVKPPRREKPIHVPLCPMALQIQARNLCSICQDLARSNRPMSPYHVALTSNKQGVFLRDCHAKSNPHANDTTIQATGILSTAIPPAAIPLTADGFFPARQCLKVALLEVDLSAGGKKVRARRVISLLQLGSGITSPRRLVGLGRCRAGAVQGSISARPWRSEVGKEN